MRTVKYIRDEPIYVYMAKSFPISIDHLLPFISVLGNRLVSRGNMEKFIDQIKGHGFPIRIGE
jgi:hypothetical protein